MTQALTNCITTIESLEKADGKFKDATCSRGIDVSSYNPRSIS